jgi:hypothetical protein
MNYAVVKANVSAWGVIVPKHQKHAVDEGESKN